MARSKSFFNQRSGSTREHTYYVQDGEQITRSRVSHVKNPRSIAQMQQRMIMATCMAAYKGMKEIVDHSWEGVEYGAKSFQKFMSANSKLLRDNINNPIFQCSFNPYHDRLFRGGELLISDGSVPMITNPANTDETSSDFFDIYIQTKEDGEGLEDGTISEFANNWGLEIGDCITVIYLLTYKNATPILKYATLELLLKDDTNITDTQKLRNCFSIDSNCDSYLDSDDSAQFQLSLSFLNNRNETYQPWWGIFVSKKNGDKWLRSKSYIRKSGNYIPLFSPSDALATYPIRHVYPLNGQQSL